MSRQVRAVIVHTDGRVTDERVPDELSTWQRAVGGDIEGVVVGPAVCVYCNESGLLDGLPHNDLAASVVIALRPDMATTLAMYGLRGDVVFLGCNTAGDSVDCPASIAQLVHHLAAAPR